MSVEFKIVKASRYVKVIPFTERAKTMCLRFQSRFIHHNYNKDEASVPKVYAIGLRDNSEFRFHGNTYKSFMVHVRESHFKEESYEIIEKPLPNIEKRVIKVRPEWIVRDYQEPIVGYMASPLPTGKFIGIATGEGKTFCSLCGVAALGYRTIVIVEGGLVTKWASDIIKVLKIDPKRTLCVRGGAQLKGLIGMAKTKEFEKIDVILLSNSTLQDWITAHETMATGSDKDIGYGLDPEEFYEYLGIGHRLIDEVHKKFHFNFKQDLYTNTHYITSLSATLFSYDKVLEGFYELAYPKDERYNGGEIKKYTLSFSVKYRLANNRKVRVREYGRQQYSHNAFESSVLKNKEFVGNYFEMISETIDIGYIANYKPGNKVAIYVSSVAFATELVKYLRKRFPDKSVERYASSIGDPYKNLLDPDIRVTTLGSGGTGHDIPGLTDTILTVAIMSLQANIQVFGRTRFIPDQDTRFYYFSCLDIEQHTKYDTLKVKLMQERAKTFETLNYNLSI